MSNAASIFNASITKLETLLGATYKRHENFFDYNEQSTVKLDNGFSIIMLDAEEKSPQANTIFLERQLKVSVTHRTFASADAGKVITKLATVYDKEQAIIDDFRVWRDTSIGLIAALPKTNTKIEQLFDGEDSFIVNTITFVIIYKN